VEITKVTMMNERAMGLSEEGTALKELCDSMAKEVASSIRDMVGDPASGQVMEMGADGTPTKSIDRIAEKAALSVLKDSEHGFAVLSEEMGNVLVGKEPKYFLHLDPLDGTFNAINGIPFYAISIYIRNEDCRFAYVSDLAHSSRFFAESGKGAYMERNDTLSHLNVSSARSIKDFSISAYTIRPNTSRLAAVGDRVRRIRSYGCTSLEICLVAQGKLDAFVDLRGRIRIVDIAAAKLIVEEAGGWVTDGKGRAIELGADMWQSDDMIASNGTIHDQLIELVGGGSN
jgi:myo-inositol-1(or 4)-monophosphatase